METPVKILVVITDGTEDIEAVVPIDLFRRANFEVTIAGETKEVTFARGVKVIPDALLTDISEDNDFDLIFVPGGAKGVENLLRNQHLGKILQNQKRKNRWIASICAGPLVLDKFNILEKEQNITSHPSVRIKLTNYNYLENKVVVSGKVITSRGAGTSIDFALKIIELLGGKELADKIANDIVYYSKSGA
ncbi:MAG: hypothetical protein CH6_4133 [Candidatus Kapaibacterium sp.]|nr:MAG: hypothetical protein CH6_4133 [Candidatus Kapabacteria bacterium]